MARSGAFSIICNNDKVLLVKRTDYPFWDLPGGGVQKDETGIQAAIRETEEETGYKVQVKYKIGTYNRPEAADVQHIFFAEVFGGEVIKKGGETAELKWFSKNLLPLLMVPHRKRQIKDFYTGCKNIIKTLKEPLIIKLIKK